jgi:sec-independent protein translocase protein TatA
VKPGLFQILIIALIVLVLFGRGRISEMMGDFGKGLKSFRRGLDDDEPAPARLEAAEMTAEPAADKTAG